MEISKRNLDRLAKRKITKRALAAELGISECYLNRLTPPLPPGPVRAKRLARADLAQQRRNHRMKLAKMVQSGRRNIESAAKEARCSVRTLYRYLAKL
jgi:DNA-binding Xre family transcriptional regulator